MIIIKKSSSKGTKLYNSAVNYEGKYLTDVYEKPSQAKIDAWNQWYDNYLSDPAADGWGICSHNSYSFTLSYITNINNEDVLLFITKDYVYAILLDK